MLVHRKDDPFFSHRYQVYLRQKLHHAIENGLQNKTLVTNHLDTPQSKEQPTNEVRDKLIENKIASLRREVQELMQLGSVMGGGSGGGGGGI